jgi:hypothetical protein
LAGTLSGILSILSVWIAGKYFGASTTFVRSTGMFEKILGPDKKAKKGTGYFFTPLEIPAFILGNVK